MKSNPTKRLFTRERLVTLLMTRTPILFVASLLLVAGCANYQTEKHFERDPEKVAESKVDVSASDRATVYYFRPRAFLQQMIYIPIPPFFYALDGKMTAVMPLGSHVVLSLPPGQHTFSRITVDRNLLFQVVTKREDVSVELAAGKTYYVGGSGFAGVKFALVDQQAGKAAIAESELAKVIHQPATVDGFITKVVSANRPRDEKTSSFRDALPSATQISSFLEGLAAVAVVGLTIVAAVADGMAQAQQHYTPPITTTVVIQQASKPNLMMPVGNSWQNSSGVRSEIRRGENQVTVTNFASGVSYRISGNRIYGSDGSGFQILGSSIISDTGQTYRLVGNRVYASDGRSCLVVGTIITCDQ